ncbi:MAG TPA: DUF349 domain-containing protein, partial [Blastococcus sp.]
MSSTDNPGSGAQQASPPIVENKDAISPEAVNEETATPEAVPDAVAPEAVTPDAGTPTAPSPADAALADPTADPEEPAAEPAADPAAEPAAEVSPESVVPKPAAPKPMAPRPMAPRPPAPSPAPAAAPAAAAPVEVPAAEVSDPSAWGRVDEDGTVYVRTADGERAVGSWQAGEPAAGLAHYGRRYDDLATEVSLLEARLKAHTGNPGEIKSKAQVLAESIPTAAAVGDLDGLAARAQAMVGTADSAAAESRAEKAAARAGQIARKEALAVEAEQIAAESTAWKAAGDRLKAIVEEWKTIRGIDRKTDEALWTRFAAARDAFGRRRGAHFASLDAQRGEARQAKQDLITEAQKLATSTDWGPTSAAMR